MSRLLRKVMNDHENNFPEQRGVNDIAIKDLSSKGELSPSKPIAMHSAYTMDKSTRNRPLYSDNYDHGIHPYAKNKLHDEVHELAELSSFLHHPEFIMEDKKHSSKNHKMAKEILQFLVKKHKGNGNAGHSKVMRELHGPLYSALMEKLSHDDTFIRQVLGPAMVKNTPHKHKDYMNVFGANFSHPAIDSYKKGHFKRGIADLMGAKYG